MSKSKSNRPEMGKLDLWKFFASVRSIRPYLPLTEVLNKRSLDKLLSKYSSVHVKPNYGQCGWGVIRAWRIDNGFAFVREHGNAIRCKTMDELFTRVKSRRVQVVQRSIDLATIDGCPFDIRVLMMRNARGYWQYVGMLAKVAGSGWIITNKRSHGYVLTVDEAFRQAFDCNDTEIARVKDKMMQLGYDICERFDDYKRYRQIGIDMGIDKRGRLWVIEENTGPAWTLFKKLSDRSMYEKIRSIKDERKEAATKH